MKFDLLTIDSHYQPTPHKLITNNNNNNNSNN